MSKKKFSVFLSSIFKSWIYKGIQLHLWYPGLFFFCNALFKLPKCCLIYFRTSSVYFEVRKLKSPNCICVSQLRNTTNNAWAERPLASWWNSVAKVRLSKLSYQPFSSVMSCKSCRMCNEKTWKSLNVIYTGVRRPWYSRNVSVPTVRLRCDVRLQFKAHALPETHSWWCFQIRGWTDCRAWVRECVRLCNDTSNIVSQLSLIWPFLFSSPFFCRKKKKRLFERTDINIQHCSRGCYSWWILGSCSLYTALSEGWLSGKECLCLFFMDSLEPLLRQWRQTALCHKHPPPPSKDATASWRKHWLLAMKSTSDESSLEVVN